MTDYPCKVASLAVYIDPEGKSWSNQEAIDRVVKHVDHEVRAAARFAKGLITISVQVTVQKGKHE